MKNRSGIVLIISTTLMCLVFAVVCAVVPIISENFRFSDGINKTAMIVFLYITVIPVFVVLYILLRSGIDLTKNIFISNVYSERFKHISLLAVADTVLYIIPDVIFISKQNLQMICLCFAIQIFGLCICGICYAASVIMTKATEYKDEIDYTV